MKTIAPRSITSRKTRRIVLIGNPNSGKSTLFNRLTGMRQKVANYPGVTVEIHEGGLAGAVNAHVIDLPGCYSLSPRSLDQRITRDALLGWSDGRAPADVVVIVIDASNLERNLFLATQILELNLPTIIACNMLDVARRRGCEVDVDTLSKKLRATVVGTVGSSGEGIEELRAAIDAAREGAVRKRQWVGTDAFESLVDRLGELAITHGVAEARTADAVGLLLLSPSALRDDDPTGIALPDLMRRPG